MCKSTKVDCPKLKLFYFFLLLRPENADTSFKWEDLMLKTNSELLANLGNFVNRALKFCKDNFDGVLGKIQLTNEDKQILAQINRCLKQYIELLEKCREREAISQILNISRIGKNHSYKYDFRFRNLKKLRQIGNCYFHVKLMNQLITYYTLEFIIS